MRTRMMLLAVLLTALGANTFAAQDDRSAGISLTQKGSIVRREKPDAKWQYVDKNEALKTGDLLLGLPGASLECRDKAVKMTFLTDFGDSPFPVIECAVVLHEAKGNDLNLTLERGRADFTNIKTKGEAKVRLHVHDQVFDLTLHEPKTRVAVELYGRWLPGVRFEKQPQKKDVPAANLVLLVLEGSAELKQGDKAFAMAAPPGPALIQWDNLHGLDATPRQLPSLPPWARPNLEANPRVQAVKKNLTHYYELAKTKPLDQALMDFIASDDPDYRRAFVVFCGATDQLQLLAPVMVQPKYADQWDDAIRVLRHWIGRGPGQDQKLYQALIDGGHFKPVDAETALQLLHSFDQNDRASPATYETLLDYLEDERLLIRALANWHLVRLVPEGRQFKYNPTADKKDREQAVKEWRKLIPPGKLPPKNDK